jgi:ABC-type transporter Mla subunit MlaD
MLPCQGSPKKPSCTSTEMESPEEAVMETGTPAQSFSVLLPGLQEATKRLRPAYLLIGRLVRRMEDLTNVADERSKLPFKATNSANSPTRTLLQR